MKLHQSIQLTQSEIEYWNIFTKEEKSFIITGDSQLPLDFTKYQAGYYSGENINQFVRQQLPVQPAQIQELEDLVDDPDLFADEPPYTSSSEDSNPALRHNISTGSEFNPFSEDSRSQQSARTSSPTRQRSPQPGTSAGTTEKGESSPENFSTPPQSLPKSRGRPQGAKNRKRTVLDFGPDPIGQRTRSKVPRTNTDEDGDQHMDVVGLASLSCSLPPTTSRSFRASGRSRDNSNPTRISETDPKRHDGRNPRNS